jgi:hypothetical protein
VLLENMGGFAEYVYLSESPYLPGVVRRYEVIIGMINAAIVFMLVKTKTFIK